MVLSETDHLLTRPAALKCYRLLEATYKHRLHAVRLPAAKRLFILLNRLDNLK